MIKIGFLTLIALCTLSLPPVLAAEFDGSITGKARVVSADTIVIGNAKIKLADLEGLGPKQSCFFENQILPCGRIASDALHSTIADKNITCALKGANIYSVLLAECRMDNTNLNAWLVKSGWAFSDSVYQAEQKQAQSEKSGAWRFQFIFPEKWRDGNY